MISNIYSLITSPKSQVDLVVIGILPAGVVTAMPVFVYGRYKPKPPAMKPGALARTEPCETLTVIILQR